VLWKELYAEPMIRLGSGGQAISLALWVFALLIGGYVLVLTLAMAAAGGSLGTFTNALCRFGGTALALLMFLGIALRAAGTLSGERDRQTFDSLLTTPLESRTILFDKWLGSMLGVRKAWLFLGPLWVLALLTGGLHPLALPLLAAAWLSYAAFVAGFGMFCSLLCRTTLSASVATVLGLAAVGIAPWALWSLYRAVWYPYPPGIPPDLEWVEEFQFYGLTPPVTLGLLAFRGVDFHYDAQLMRGPPPPFLLTGQMVAYAVIGVACYALAALALWGPLLARFGPATGRLPLGRPGKFAPQT
jgi:ABC-type transport system involved in multi-copper enzyme maturation permease subunit